MKKQLLILAFLLAGISLSAQIFTPVAFDKKYHIGAGVGLSYATLKLFKKKPPVIYGAASSKGVRVGIIANMK